MEFLFRQLNPHSCLTYLIGDLQTKEVVLVDPVLDHVPDYLKLLETEKFRLVAVIDTHTHADHISGAPALLDHTHAEYIMHKNAAASCPTKRVSEGETLTLSGVPFTFIEVPGHTRDSICVLLPGKILTGDALFLDDGGAGRDDLPGGDAGAHWDSFQKLLALPEDLIIYPAHEYRHRKPSTLAQQKKSNPHLQHKSREEYIRYFQELKLGPADWMKDVLKANYACARDPKAAWIPVDVPACEVKGTMAHGANDIKVEEIAPEELSRKISSGENVLLLDVRDPEELKGELGSLPNAVNIPVAALSHHLKDIEARKNGPVVTLCKGGGRAHTAAQILIQAGFSNVKKLTGGMTAFRNLIEKK